MKQSAINITKLDFHVFDKSIIINREREKKNYNFVSLKIMINYKRNSSRESAIAVNRMYAEYG